MSHCVTAFYIDQKMEMERMLKTLHHFHPDITEEIFEQVQPNEVPNLDIPYFDDLITGYQKYTHVIHIDADVLIVDKIDELFSEEYDAIAGRNNCDNLNLCSRVGGWTINDIDPNKYVSTAVHTISSKFCKDWYELCTLTDLTKLPCRDQDVFNILFNYKGYKTKILDPIESNVYWGTSTLYGKNYVQESWKDIIVIGDHLELNNKRIKMLHFAGGSPKPPLDDLVTKDVFNFIMDTILIPG